MAEARMWIHYPQLYKRIDMVASALLNYGIEPGEMVSVCLPNSPEVSYVFYAIQKIGAVANMVAPGNGESLSGDARFQAKNKLLITQDTVEDKNGSVDWNVFLQNYGTYVEDVVLQQDVAFVVCNHKCDSDKEYLATEIMTFCREQLPEYVQPADVRFVDKLQLS